jgi:integrase
MVSHWSLPAERMKAGMAFIAPLSGLALDLLRSYLRPDPRERLFSLGINELQQAAQRIVAGLGMARWTPHDLRRTDDPTEKATRWNRSARCSSIPAKA